MAHAQRARNLLLVARDGLIVGLSLLPYIVIVALFREGQGAFDLHVFWDAAHAVADGVSPYDPAGVAHARALVEADAGAGPPAAWAVYPPAVYALLVPLALLPWHVAATIGLAGIAAAGFLALRVMGVRDWRCYAVAFGSAPFAVSLLEGTISTAIMLAVALAWRGRLPASLSAAALVAKLFVWPLAFVVAALYGYRRAALLLGGAFAAVAASWAIIGFADMRRYPGLLSDLTATEGHNSFSTAGLAYALGAPAVLGQLIGVVLGLALALLAYRAGTRGRRDDAFTLAIVAALVASPIVWAHYFVLIFLPLAMRAPRLSMLWLAFLPLWVGSPIAAKGQILPFLVSWPAIALVAIVALRPLRADAMPVASETHVGSPVPRPDELEARAAA